MWVCVNNKGLPDEISLYVGVADVGPISTDEGEGGSKHALNLESFGDLVEPQAKRSRIDTKVDDSDVKGISGNLDGRSSFDYKSK